MTQTPGLLSQLRPLDAEHGAVRVEDVFDTDAADLWGAVTTPERLARWLLEVEGDLRVGGTFRTSFTSGWEGTGRVDVCDAPRHLLVSTQLGEPDEGTLEAWLTDAGDGRTRLVIEERGLELEHLPGHGAGWQAHVEDLRSHLADPSAQATHETWSARWHELSESYAESDRP